MLSINNAECHIQDLQAECHFAECRGAMETVRKLCCACKLMYLSAECSRMALSEFTQY
jgi:hypothetical protein